MSYFQEILEQANANVCNKKIAKIGNQKNEIDRRNEAKKSVPQTSQPKIPLKLKASMRDGSKQQQQQQQQQNNVDKERIAAFLRKKENEKKKIEIEKQKQKENIIRLRMQSFGGKANKKIAKQFRTTAVSLQEKFGTDKDHEEHLRRIEQREAEEADRLSCEVRQGVLMAMERKKKIDEITKRKGNAALPNKGFCAKKDILYLTKNDKVCGPSSSSKSIADEEVKQKMKQIPSKKPKTMNFSSLMEKAAKNNNKLNVGNNKRDDIGSKSISERNHTSIDTSDHRNSLKNSRNSTITSKPSPLNRQPPQIPKNSQSQSILNRIPKKTDGRDKPGSSEINNRLKNVPSNPKMQQVERKYLPGDMRYQAPNKSQINAVNKSASIKPSASGIKRTMPMEKMETKRPCTGANYKTVNELKNRTSANKYPNNNFEKRNNNYTPVRPSSSKYYDDDDEYDSEMDDFIDDTEVDDHLQRKDLEETLRMINPRYNKTKWKMNEMMIDDRHMEANFRDVTREERKSARIGLMEDIREAQLGKSIPL